MSEETCPGVECCYPIFEDCAEVLPPLVLDTTILPCQSLCLGDEYEATVVGSGGESPYTYELVLGALPNGLSFNATTGIISGTTTTAGIFTFTIRVTDVNGTQADTEYILGVLQITTITLDDYTVGAPYSFQLEAIGGGGTYGWRIESGSLPDGLSMSEAGLITGTPTGESGGGDIEFEVVDPVCEALAESFFAPSVELITEGTTEIKTMRGWAEYVAGTGALYKRLTPTGFMTQTGFTAPLESPLTAGGDFAGGAKYIYSGYSEIDIYGNLIATHSKTLYEACTALAPLIKTAVLLPTDPLTYAFVFADGITTFLGYCWNTDPNSCASCSQDESTWDSDTDSAIAYQYDYPTNMIRDDVSNLTTAPTQVTYSGDYAVVYKALFGVTNYPHGVATAALTADVAWTHIASTGEWAITLSDEYTDADAEASKVSYTNNSRMAENKPDYQNWTHNYLVNQSSRVTSVEYTLNFENLIAGTDYSASVTYQSSNGDLTVIPYTFTASGETHQIVDTIPTPAAGFTTIVRTPTVAYA